MNTKKLLLLVLALLCVTCLAFSACQQTPNSNAISGLTDISLKCGDTLPIIAPVAEYGTVKVTYAKAVEGTAKENLTYADLPQTLPQVGTYYLKATVQAGDNYEGATAYATLTISHQDFADITGEGTLKEEPTTDGKYKTWTEKECACGTTIKGAETISDKKANAINGLPAQLTLVCGSAIDVSSVTSTHGTPVVEVAIATEGVEKEDLTYGALPTSCAHGVYYVRVTVAEGDNYQSAVAYAKVTVNHQAYTDITTDVQHQAAEGTTKGYDYKLCTCGERVKGETEYVIVTIKQDGAVIDAQEHAIGSNVTRPADDKITTRSGYVATLLLSGNVWNAGETVEDFATIELTTRWLQKTVNTIDKVNTNWLFIAGTDTGLTDETVNKLTEEDSLWKIETLYNPENPASPAELTLGDIAFKINHTYQLTVVSTQRTRICFGTGTWDTNSYLITEEMVNKPVVITITYTGSNTIVTYNGEARTYTNDEWSVHNLNGLNFAIQDKDAQNETEHPHFFVSIKKQVIDLYDYVADETRIVASLPAVDSIDENNADDVLALISQIEALRTAHFTTAQNASATDISAHKQKAQQIAADHVLNLKKLENVLPDFDTMWTADKDTQNTAYKALTKYLAYYNVMFTAEEKEAYTEPKKIAFYREFFKDRTLVTDNAFAESTASFIPWDSNPTTHWNPNNQEGTITFPQIAFGAFDRVQFYVQCAGGTDDGNIITFGDVQIKGNGQREFIITKKDDGWYVSFAIPGNHTGDGIKLSNDVVLGNQALQITFKNDGWGWFVIGREKESDLNTISGTLTAGTTTVHKITYSYQTNAGERTETKYYLANETLVLPNVSSYTDAEAKHTLVGWFVDETEYKAGATVTASINLVAKYEVKNGDYIDYTVDYIVDDDTYGEQQTYRYNGNLVLPENPTKVSDDDTKEYVFQGWFDGETEYKAGDLVTENLELVAKFKLVDKQRTEFTVTLTNLDGDNKTVSVYDGEVAELPTVTRNGYVFEGWSKDGNKYDTSAEVTGNITLAAKWLAPNAYKGMLGTSTTVTGEGTTVTDSAWVDSRGNAFTRYWTPSYEGDNVWIKVPTTLFATNDSLEMFVEIATGSFSLTCDDVTTNDGYMGGKDLGYKLQISFYKQGTTWYIKTAQWAKEIPTEVISGDVVTMHVWCNTHETVKVSEVVGYGDVDYVAKVTEVATAIENLAVGTDNTVKATVLKEYRSWRNHFTSYELANIQVPAKVKELETELGGGTVVETIWTPTTDNLSSIGFQGTSDHVGISTMGQNWMTDKDSNIFQTAYTRNCQGAQDIVLTLPVCNYAVYTDVRFCLWVQNTAGTTQSLTINGQTAPMSTVGSTVYVVYIKTVNNATTFEVCYNGSSAVVASGSLSTAVAAGQEALTLTISVDGWTQLQLSEIYGRL